MPISSSPTPALLRLLLDRLERISVDSHWAHRASGVRGSLLKMLEQIENGEPLKDPDFTLRYAFRILEYAAREKAR
jgi:hypothetical protein